MFEECWAQTIGSVRYIMVNYASHCEVVIHLHMIGQHMYAGSMKIGVFGYYFATRIMGGLQLLLL